MRYLRDLLAGFLLMSCLACVEANSPHEMKATEKREEELHITFGGFVQGGPEDQLLNGVCGSDVTRNILNCDVHNGLMNWNITEVTFQVLIDGDNAPHYYRERLPIGSLQTEHVSIRLGMQLPLDHQLIIRGRPVGEPSNGWHWLIVGARGQHVAS